MADNKLYLRVHFVWSVQGRVPLIQPEWEGRMYEYIGAILRNRNCHLIRGGGTKDHLHLLTALSSTIPIADCVSHMKANTSKWINEKRLSGHRFSWQKGYGAFTVSRSQEDTLVQYIDHQKQHHAKKTYQEEFLEFLQRHEIEYDERFLWQ